MIQTINRYLKGIFGNTVREPLQRPATQRGDKCSVGKRKQTANSSRSSAAQKEEVRWFRYFR